MWIPFLEHLSLLALGLMALVSPQWAQMAAVALGLDPILAWHNYH